MLPGYPPLKAMFTQTVILWHKNYAYILSVWLRKLEGKMFKISKLFPITTLIIFS